MNLSDIKEIDSLLNKLNHNNTEEKEAPLNDDDKPQNKGKLIVDATCAPADVHYPTDLGLLNKARQDTELMIDILLKTRTNKGNHIKLKTYRKKGRKVFLDIIKQKRPGKKKIRQAICFQLNRLKRNLKSIGELSKVRY